MHPGDRDEKFSARIQGQAYPWPGMATGTPRLANPLGRERPLSGVATMLVGRGGISSIDDRSTTTADDRCRHDERNHGPTQALTDAGVHAGHCARPGHRSARTTTRGKTRSSMRRSSTGRPSGWNRPWAKSFSNSSTTLFRVRFSTDDDPLTTPITIPGPASGHRPDALSRGAAILQVVGPRDPLGTRSTDRSSTWRPPPRRQLLQRTIIWTRPDVPQLCTSSRALPIVAT